MCRREAGEPRPQSCRCRFEWRSRCEFLGHARLCATLRPPCPQRAVVAVTWPPPCACSEWHVTLRAAGASPCRQPGHTGHTARAGSSRTPCGAVWGWDVQQASIAGGRGFPGEGTFGPEAGSVSAAGTNSGRSAVSLPGRRGEVALCWVPGCRPCATANLGSVLGEVGIFNPDLSTGHGAAVPDPGEGCQPRWQRPGEGHFTPLPTPKFCIIFHFRIRKCRPL